MAAEGKAFQTELRFFEGNRKEWLQSHPGEFALISDTTLAGFYPDYESAFRAGLKRFGVRGSFLVKQVWAEEPVYLIH